MAQRGQGVAMACASALQNMPDIFGRSPVDGGPAGAGEGRIRRDCRAADGNGPFPAFALGTVRKVVIIGASAFKLVRQGTWWFAPTSRRWCCMTNLVFGARGIRCAASVN